MDIAGTAIVLLILFCAVLLVLFHRCATERRSEREYMTVEHTRTITLLQRCEESREQLRQLLTRLRIECESRVDRVRSEAAAHVTDALRELDKRDHRQAKEQREVVLQQSLRSAATAMDKRSTPLLDLEQDIRRTYAILADLQDQHRLSADPLKRAELADGADRTHAELVLMLHRYKEATDAFGEPMAMDIGEIMVLLGE